ncbi:MAG: hypothetical protein Q8O99_03930 [bacterium]|nr:hypothetical protein [bacterium]
MCYLPGSPVLVLYAPTSGDTTTESSILVQGNATGLTLSEVLVNGTTVAVTATGYFEISVGLMK